MFNWKRQRIVLQLYNLFFSLSVTDAVWVLFLLSRGFTLAQVGVAEGVFHVTSFLCEVPTGMAADLLGRRGTLATAGVMGVVSALAMAYSTGFGGVCLSMLFHALMLNLISGTQEALAYDSMVAAGREKDYLHFNAWINGISRTVSALSCLAGGAAIWLGYFKTYWISAMLSGAVAALALALAEPAVTQAQHARKQHPFANFWPRLCAHVKLSFVFLWRHPRTACVILGDAAVGVPIYLTFMYLQEALVDGGLPAAFLGAALLLRGLAGTAGVALGARKKRSLYLTVVGGAVLSGLGTIAAGFAFWVPALLGAMVAAVVDGAVQLRAETSLNQDFPSDQRATLISVDSMAYSMLMIVMSPLSGVVGDTWGLGWAFRVMGGGLLCGALLCGLGYRLWTRRRAAKEIQ